MENLGGISQYIGIFEKLWRFFVPPQPDLSFEDVDAEHWYNKDDVQSGLSIKMFIINRGSMDTTIRDINITKMNPDHLEYHRPMWKSPMELPVDKDKRYSLYFLLPGRSSKIF